MSKAVPWSISGVGFDAREAARDSARREGKSLGEWLHGVIADHASDAGVDAQGIVQRDRIDAVTARLEWMGAAAASRASGRARARQGRETEASPRRLRIVDDERDTERGRRRPLPADDLAAFDPPAHDPTELLLDEAIEAMERRTQQTERRTDDALASVARLIETSEARRERERVGVADLARKLGNIESRLADHDPNPIHGALARLEARLEQIGRRTEAAPTVAARSEPDRLEDKLNAVLDALSRRQPPAPTQASSVALATAQSRAAPAVELPLRRRRLGDAIAEIADRQRTLETPRGSGAPAAGLFGRQRESAMALREPAMALREPAMALREPAMALREPVAAPRESRFDLEGLRGDVATMAEQLRGLAPRGSVVALEGQLARLETQLGSGESDGSVAGLRADVRALEGRLDDIARTGTPIAVAARLQSQLEEIHELVARRPAPAPSVDTGALEGLVRDLAYKIEAVQAPNADQHAVDALQRQIGTLTSRMETTETGLGSLASLERSMRDLFAHLDETRSYAEAAASRAAQEAVRTAIVEKGFDRPAPRADVAVLKAMQEDADLRTRSTLDAVHAALEKVVDRLQRVEGDLAETRRGTGPSASDDGIEAAFTDLRRGEAPARDLALGAGEPLLDPRIPSRPASRRPAAGGPKPEAAALKADYIAAARRAALSAQTDPSVVSMRRLDDEPSAGRADLAVKSRDFVASHKRPVLLSLAAVLVVAVTTALVQLMPYPAAGPEIADNAVPARVVAAAEPSRARPSRDGALSPSALPRSNPALAAQIPGSDPIVTGSIANLPSFARPAMTPPPAPTLPVGLTAAADSGDGAAQYTLAAAYAEGRIVPRDFARAAKLYAKAADQGIVPAQYRLGALYEKGLGVAQDKARAKSLYRQAADAGNPRAMHNLAVLLADGDGKPDYEGAATWFRKAAQYGVHDSQFNLAILLARGLGVEQSMVQSYQWFSIAAAQGDNDAAAKRDEVGTKLGASELSVAKALAAAFRPRTPDIAAVDVTPPPAGWDGASAPLHLNSARSKISSL